MVNGRVRLVKVSGTNKYPFVLIPKLAQKTLAIKKGDYVQMMIEDDYILLKPYKLEEQEKLLEVKKRI
ncbi:MAG: hypothetical protein QXZ17_15685 [Nitrososphaerota archaeon]